LLPGFEVVDATLPVQGHNYFQETLHHRPIVLAALAHGKSIFDAQVFEGNWYFIELNM
jgi:hypothetical protein